VDPTTLALVKELGAWGVVVGLVGVLQTVWKARLEDAKLATDKACQREDALRSVLERTTAAISELTAMLNAKNAQNGTYQTTMMSKADDIMAGVSRLEGKRRRSAE